MLTSKQSDRALPTFISLLVIGVLLMTFDVRLEGGGVVGVLRSGTQAIVSPMQRVAAYAVNPIANALDSLSNVASLREQNAALSAQLAEAQAALVAVQDDKAKLTLLEQIYDLETDGAELGQTVANVIGSVDAALIIDKGTRNGVLTGQPVIDTNGYVIGTVKSASDGRRDHLAHHCEPGRSHRAGRLADRDSGHSALLIGSRAGDGSGCLRCT